MGIYLDYRRIPGYENQSNAGGYRKLKEDVMDTATFLRLQTLPIWSGSSATMNAVSRLREPDADYHRNAPLGVAGSLEQIIGRLAGSPLEN